MLTPSNPNKVQTYFFVRPPSKCTRAFSLVEVILAMGVASFALMAIVALIPMSLITAKRAADATTESQIVQFARNEMQLTSFTNLATWGTQKLYFDNQGLPTVASDPQRIYQVTFTVTNVAFSCSNNVAQDVFGPNPNLPNNAADAQMVQVNIVNRTIASGSTTNIFPIVVPNAGF